jgi:hypothetical protein
VLLHQIVKRGPTYPEQFCRLGQMERAWARANWSTSRSARSPGLTDAERLRLLSGRGKAEVDSRQPTAANCSSSQRHASRGFRARAHFRATDNHSAWPTPYCRNRAPSVRIPLPPECTCSAAPPTIPVRRPAAQSLHNAGPDHFRAAARKSCRTVTGLGAITPRVAARSMRAKPCICVPPWRYA